MATHIDDNLSDDEIFFGKMTMKEVKKHFEKDMHRHSVTCNTRNEDNDNEMDDSFKLIETCSEPDHKLSSSSNDSDLSSSMEIKEASSKWKINSTNDSFLEMEKIVSEIDKLSTNEQKCMDNTLDVVDFILNNGPSVTDINISQNESVHSNDSVSNSQKEQHAKEEFKVKNISLSEEELKCKVIKNVKATIQSTPQHSTEYLSNNSAYNQTSVNRTESLKNNIPDKIVAKVDNFKTPKANFSAKKSKVLTPNKAYKNVISPVANYIKSTSQVSTVKNIKLTKPLRGTSSIPTLLRSDKTKPNKENVSLLFVAHKSAKNMKVTNSSDNINAISPWKKQLTSSLPTSIVIKHVQKEKIHQTSKNPAESQQEDSFANLVLHQAEVSLCTVVSCNSEKKKK